MTKSNSGAAAGARGLTTDAASQGVEGRPLTPYMLQGPGFLVADGPSTEPTKFSGTKAYLAADVDAVLAAADAAREALRVERDEYRESAQAGFAAVSELCVARDDLRAEVARLRAQLEEVTRERDEAVRELRAAIDDERNRR